MRGRTHVGVGSLLLGLSTAVVGVLLLPGCGGSGGTDGVERFTAFAANARRYPCAEVD